MIDLAVALSPALPDRLSDAKILVVDDVQLNRFLVVQLLQKIGYTHIEQAENGKAALHMLREFEADLIVLDLKMPVMDGFEFCTRLRREPRFDNTPVIALTMLTEDSQKVRIFELGASDYIPKPVQPGEMAWRIRIHLEKKFLVEDLRQYQSRVSHELAAAREIQQRLLPSESHVRDIEERYGLSIASRFLPSSELGGDCWGIQPLDEHRLAFYIYDFSGHGVSAALNVVRLQTLIGDALDAHTNPSAFMAALNEELLPLLARDEFAAMFYALVDLRNNTIEYASSSMPSPLLVQANAGICTALDGSGLPLGKVTKADYPSHHCNFPPGSGLILYSDALVEDPSKKGDILSLGAIYHAIAQSSPAMQAESFVSILAEKYRHHIGGHQQDDLTLAMLLRPEK